MTRLDPLAAAIRRLFDGHIVLSADAKHYIDSTLSHPTPEELAAVLADDGHPEHDPLMEMICFPEVAFQVEIEPMAQALRCNDDDLARLLDPIMAKSEPLRIRPSDSEPDIRVPLPAWGVERFLERLHLTRVLDARFLEAASRILPEDRARLFAVHLRNSRMVQDDRRVLFLCNLIRRMDGIAESDFSEALGFLESLPDGKSIYTALMMLKRGCLKALQEAEKLAEEMQTKPMEVLMLQGVRAASVDREAMRRRIRWADAVSEAVFGITRAMDMETPLERHVTDIRTDLFFE